MQLVSVLQRMARGETDAEIAESVRHDEIGAVGKAVDGIKAMVARKAAEEAEVKRLADAAAAAERRRTMIELADGFERAVGGIVGTVFVVCHGAAGDSQHHDRDRDRNRHPVYDRRRCAEEAASNVNTVAAAAEELGTSVQEIGRQVSGSARLAQQAVVAATRRLTSSKH